jgi:rare lipoprotein A
MKVVIIAVMTLSQAQAFHTGIASWYGHESGNRTASGEKWNPHGYSCATWEYPFNTKLLVKNLRNGKTVIVRVNDRGPSTRLRPKRIIDLSEGSASIIGMKHSGVARVSVDVVN